MESLGTSIIDILNLILQRSAFFQELLLEHLYISTISIILASIFGLALAVFISEYRRYSGVVLTIINFLYVIPSISMLGLLIPISGIGNTTAIIALFIYALLPMVRGTYTTLISIDPKILDAAKGMGSSPLQMIYKIKLPLALPSILSSIKNMTVMTISLTGIASFIGAGGLGVAIYRGITTNNPTMIIAGSLLIALLALLSDFIISSLEKRSINHKLNFKPLAIILLISVIAVYVLSNKKEKGINVACKPMTEQLIIAHLIEKVVENNSNIPVNLTLGVGGGTANLHPAMVAKKFDIYPEYTGTGWNAVLKKKSIYQEKNFPLLQKEYQNNFQISWLGYLGFNNTFGIAIRAEVAEQYNIKTYSDLALYAEHIKFGAEPDFFERKDGYAGLKAHYGLDFNEIKDLEVSLKYNAIMSGEVDAINIFTTDARLNTPKIKVLIDDKNYYPSYKCCLLIRNGTLSEYPELESILESLKGKLSDATITQLSAEVEIYGKAPEEVAEEFIHKSGLVK